MWRKFELLICALSLVSCASNHSDSGVFQKTADAKVTIIGEPLITGVPIDLCVEGDHVFVLAYTPSSWIHVYDLKTGAPVSEALASGRGPGEAVEITSMDYDRAEKTLYLHDMMLRKTLKYKLDGKSGKAEYTGELEHPKQGVINGCHMFKGGTFLYEGYFPEYDRRNRYMLYDGEKVIDTYSEYPGAEDAVSEFAFRLGSSRSDFQSGRFVSGTLFGGVLECFDVSDGSITRSGLQILESPGVEISGGIGKKADTKWGFSTFCPTKDVIYANYMDNLDETDFTTISTFGWDGQALVRYDTGHNILRICASQKQKNVLYGIVSSEDMEFNLAKIDLK